MTTTTQNILIGLGAFAAGAFLFKNKSASVGAAKIEDTREESLRLAIQLGLLKPKGDYERREAGKGAQIFSKKLMQKLGPDNKEQREELTQAVNQGASSWIADRISWLLNGSYGSELKYYMDNQISMLNTSGIKSFKNSLDSYAKLAMLVLITSEMYDVNRAAIMSAIKKASPSANEQLLEAVKNEIVEYYLEQSELFNRA